MNFNTKDELRKEIEKQYKEHPKYIDVTNWDVSNVKDMSFLFADLEDLEQIKGIYTWDISKLEDAYGIFAGCTNLPTGMFDFIQHLMKNDITIKF